MAITISGENNNDRILASDGVIDQISGINIVGLITASHINVGSNIQLGNAGIVTATTFVGNLTGNVNSTSPLLLQTGGSERFRITGNNELGIAGANYGTSGQVLTSGGSGSAVSWTTIPTQVTISGNANNRLITGGSGTQLVGEASLQFDGTRLGIGGAPNNIALDVTKNTQGGIRITDTAVTNASYELRTQTGNSTKMFRIIDVSANSDRLRITSGGQIGIGNITPDTWSTGNGLTIGTSQATLWGVGDQVNLSGNAYFNSGWKAAASKAGASQIEQALGNIDFKVSGSVTADNSITWINALRITSDGNIGFNRTNVNAGDNSTQTSTATPKRIVYNNDYSNGYTDASLKLYLFNDGATRQGFTSGPLYDLQYHSSGHATHAKHSFFTQNVERLRITSDGNITQTGSVYTIDSTGSAGVSLDRGNTSSGATIDFKTAGALKWYTGLRGLVNDNFYLRNEVGSEDSITITTDGYIGINDTVPYTGLTINKEGDYWDTNGNTYAHPEGRVLSTWRGDRDNDTDYWVGFIGKYLKPSATVNILLQPHVGNFNNQAGMYIAGEATGNFSSDFTLGKIVSGNVAGRGTTASSGKRASKSELFRITNSGHVKFNSGFGSVTTVYGCRAWVKLNQTGTQTINASGGVSSIADLGTGHTQVNFTTAMPDIHYAMVGGAQQSGTYGGANNYCFSLCMQARNTTNANFIYRPTASSDVKEDNSQVDVAFFR